VEGLDANFGRRDRPATLPNFPTMRLSERTPGNIMRPFRRPNPRVFSSNRARGVCPLHFMQTSAQKSTMAVAWTAAMALLAALYFAWLIYRATLPMELGFNEPWNACHVDRVRAGEPLYADPGSSLVANNYPPLSFYFISAISSVTCDAVYVGRWVSILATLAIAGAVVSLVRQFGGSRFAAAVAAVWYLATMCRFFHTYVGMNDPHLPALAIMAWALVWFVRSKEKGRAVEPAVLLMVVAGFFKHNLFAIPVTAIAWLALSDSTSVPLLRRNSADRNASPDAAYSKQWHTRNWRQAARAAAVGLGAVAAGLAICGLAYGRNFFQQLLMPREYSFSQALAGLGRLQWIAPAIVIFLIWAWDRSRQGTGGVANPQFLIPNPSLPEVNFPLLFIAVAFVFYFLQELGSGVYDNAQFDLIVATAVGLGLAFGRLDVVPIVRRIGLDRGRAVVLAILIVRLLISSNMTPFLFAFSPSFREDLRERVAVTNAEVRRVAAMPGPVVCFICEKRYCKTDIGTREEKMWAALAYPNGGAPPSGTLYTPVMTVARRAGKPFAMDGFCVDQRVKLGLLSMEELKRRLAATGIRFVQVDARTRCVR
jgi:hypothetical protein